MLWVLTWEGKGMRLARLAGANLAGRIFLLTPGNFPTPAPFPGKLSFKHYRETRETGGRGGVHPTTNTDRLSH